MYPRIISAFTKRSLYFLGISPTSQSIHTTSALLLPTTQKHSTDLYNKEFDTSPPEDATIHQIDPEADVQRPTAPPSGEWSRAAVQSGEYEHLGNSSHPYAVPGQTQRYGNTEMWSKDKGPEASRRSEGPEGKASIGRKPEGKR